MVSSPGWDYTGGIDVKAQPWLGAPAMAARYGGGLAGTNGTPALTQPTEKKISFTDGLKLHLGYGY
jgi:hypothetical protein